MKSAKFLLLFTLFGLTFFSAHDIRANPVSESSSAYSGDTCRTYSDAERLKNTQAIIIGRLQKFTPWEKGKGAGHMFWQYEVKLADGSAIPVVSRDKSDGESILFYEFLDSNVIIWGTVYYGIIIGDSNPEHQSMTGYRIDADGIEIQHTVGDTLLTKIKIDLSQFDDEGYRVYPNGEKSSSHYEFCIPANDSLLAEVKAIDPFASEMKGSKGRSGCSDKEWLVISSTRKPGFKEIIRRTAELEYVRKITETFWE